jgi:uncharacterized protein YjiS (DUF1127 family)
MKRAVSQRSILPWQIPGQSAHDGVASRTKGARDKHRVRRVFDGLRIDAGVSGSIISEAEADGRQLRHHASAAVAAPGDAAPSRLSAPKFLSAMLGFFRARLRRRAERRALSRATDRLSRAPDYVLKDIGVTQSEIAYRIRFDRHCDDDSRPKLP